MNNIDNIDDTFSFINDALFYICENKSNNPIESLSKKMFELIGEEFPDDKIIKPNIRKKDNEKELTFNFYNTYKLLKKVGQGGYGSVYTTMLRQQEEVTSHQKKTLSTSSEGISMSSKNTDQIKAVKIIKKFEKELSESNKELLKRIDHPNIVKNFEIYEDSENYYLMQEYCEQGDLLSFIKKEATISLKMVKIIIEQILNATIYIHKSNIIHKNIKPENILVSYTGEKDENGDYLDIILKISDVGCVTFFDRDEQANFNISCYNAPESLKGTYYFKSDVWSIGVLCYLLITGKLPFNGKQNELKLQIMNKEVNYQEIKVIEYKKFLVKLLEKDPNKRVSILSCLEDAFFQKINDLNDIDSKLEKERILESMKEFKQFYKESKLTNGILAFLSNNKVFKNKYNKLNRLYLEMDKNKDGKLDFKEIYDNYSLFFNEAEEKDVKTIEDLIKSLDTNKNSKIDYSEFMVIVTKAYKLSSNQTLSSIFDMFDIDKSGYVEFSEIKKILTDLNLTDVEIKLIIDSCDLNADGKLSRKEFGEFISKFYF